MSAAVLRTAGWRLHARARHTRCRRTAHAGGPAVHAVLYGPVGAACTWEMHSVLASAVQQQQDGKKGRGAGGLVYALRPVLLPKCEVRGAQKGGKGPGAHAC